MLWLIILVIAVAVVWKYLKARGGSVTLPTVGGGTAQIDIHQAMQIWEDAIARQAREVEVEALARAKAHANIQTKADEAARVASLVTPASAPKA